MASLVHRWFYRRHPEAVAWNSEEPVMSVVVANSHRNGLNNRGWGLRRVVVSDPRRRQPASVRPGFIFPNRKDGPWVTNILLGCTPAASADCGALILQQLERAVGRSIERARTDVKADVARCLPGELGASALHNSLLECSDSERGRAV